MSFFLRIFWDLEVDGGFGEPGGLDLDGGGCQGGGIE